MKPTDKQIQWLWEQCGLSPIELRYGYRDDGGYFCEMQSNPHSKGKQGHHSEELCYLVSSDEYGEYWEIVPPIDLNNLFKYAVPKLRSIQRIGGIEFFPDDEPDMVFVNIYLFGDGGEGRTLHSKDKDPALALFWPIFSALGGDKALGGKE